MGERTSTSNSEDREEGRSRRKVAMPSGPRAVRVAPFSRGARAVGSTSVTISTATGPEGPRKVAARRFPMRSGYPWGRQPSWPASHAASQMARRGGVAGRRHGPDRDRVDPGEGVAGAGRVEELRDHLAPAGQAEPGRVAAIEVDLRVEAQAERGGVGPRVGEVEDQPRAFAGQVAEERLVEPGVVGPPEHEGEVGLEQAGGPPPAAGRRPGGRRGARSARCRPAGGRGRAGGRAPRPRPRRGDRARRCARPRSPGTDTASSRCRARRRAGGRRPAGSRRRGWPGRSASRSGSRGRVPPPARRPGPRAASTRSRCHGGRRGSPGH